MEPKILQIIPISGKLLTIRPASEGRNDWRPIVGLALVEDGEGRRLQYIETDKKGNIGLAPVNTRLRYSLEGYF